MSVSRALCRTFGRQLQFAVPWVRLTHHRGPPLFANRFSPLIRPRVASSDAEKPGCHLELSRTLEVPMQICIERSEFETTRFAHDEPDVNRTVKWYGL